MRSEHLDTACDDISSRTHAQTHTPTLSSTSGPMLILRLSYTRQRIFKIFVTFTQLHINQATWWPCSTSGAKSASIRWSSSLVCWCALLRWFYRSPVIHSSCLWQVRLFATLYEPVANSKHAPVLGRSFHLRSRASSRRVYLVPRPTHNDARSDTSSSHPLLPWPNRCRLTQTRSRSTSTKSTPWRSRLWMSSSRSILASKRNRPPARVGRNESALESTWHISSFGLSGACSEWGLCNCSIFVNINARMWWQQILEQMLPHTCE